MLTMPLIIKDYLLNILSTYYSFQGRISYKELNTRIRNMHLLGLQIGVLIIPIFIIASMFWEVSRNFIEYSSFAGTIFGVLGVISHASLFIRRGHDRNRFGWAVYIYSIFFVFSLIQFPFLVFTKQVTILIPKGFVIPYSGYLITILILILHIWLLIYVIECCPKGSVEGAVRFGKAPDVTD